MKKCRSLLFSLASIAIVAGSAAACTSLGIAPGATADGSAMVSHSVDGWYDHRIQIVPGGTHKEGDMVPIYKNICYQTQPTTPLLKVGEIPQVAETYTYFHTGYPMMNAHKLSMAEATWGGREELYCDAGWMMIEQLQVLAFQRTKTARDAIKLMGSLAEKYGYGDVGESLFISDGSEVWLFEICGPSVLWTPKQNKPGAIWVARRVPDGEVSVIANRSRIGLVDFKSPDFMYSENLTELAAKMGWWKEGEPFYFNRAYQEEGDWKYLPICSRREWRMLDRIAPSLKLSPTAEGFPFSVKPDKPLTMEQVQGLYRDWYQGTPYDESIKAGGPFKCPVLYRPAREQKPKGLEHSDWERTVSIYRCSYSHVTQAWANLPDAFGQVCWYGADEPGTTVYVPIFAGVTEIPVEWTHGERHIMDRDSAFWAFQFVNNWATLKWSYMIEDIKAEQARLEKPMLARVPEMIKEAQAKWKTDEKAVIAMLTDFTGKSMKTVARDWWRFSDMLIGKYQDGYVMTPEGENRTVGYPAEWLKEVGYGVSADSKSPR